jgi:hypothetical protein
MTKGVGILSSSMSMPCSSATSSTAELTSLSSESLPPPDCGAIVGMVLVVFNQNANDLGNCGRERQEVWPSTRSAHPVVRASHLLNLHKNKVSLLAGAMIKHWGFECCRAAATKGGTQHHLAGSPGKVWALERGLETLGAGGACLA